MRGKDLSSSKQLSVTAEWEVSGEQVPALALDLPPADAKGNLKAALQLPAAEVAESAFVTVQIPELHNCCTGGAMPRQNSAVEDLQVQCTTQDSIFLT